MKVDMSIMFTCIYQGLHFEPSIICCAGYLLAVNLIDYVSLNSECTNINIALNRYITNSNY